MEVDIFIYVCKFSDYAYKYNISQAQNAQWLFKIYAIYFVLAKTVW